jgi:hypothetical protein
MKKRMVLIGLAGLAVFLGVQGMAQKDQERRTQPFMRQKLGYAQAILEGITLERFEQVLTNATRLRDMSTTNVFLILGNPEYLQSITNFQANVDSLKAAAKDGDRDRVFQGYVKMTESCVGCHRVFRRHRVPGPEVAK